MSRSPIPDHEEATGLSWWLAIVLALSVGVLGIAIGKLISNPSHPAQGSVDVGFLQDMRYHHDQAVEMAFILISKPTNTIDRPLYSMATEVLAGQQLESGLMVQILRDWGRAEQNESGTAMGWMGMATEVKQMVGMASDDDIQQLKDKQGVDAAKWYIQLMVNHHKGGIHMAEYAVNHAATDDVRKLAASMVSGQQSEINEMQLRLTALGG
jgi:uncharacterized protein (DUF305 family)